MACLDTTVLIDLGGRNATRGTRAFRKLKELTDRGETLVTTRFNVAELYVGVARSGDPQREERAVRGLLGDLGLLEFDERAARLFGHITAHLYTIGRPTGDMDVLIAAAAMAGGHSVVTRDASHFTNIPELATETY